MVESSSSLNSIRVRYRLLYANWMEVLLPGPVNWFVTSQNAIDIINSFQRTRNLRWKLSWKSSCLINFYFSKRANHIFDTHGEINSVENIDISPKNWRTLFGLVNSKTVVWNKSLSKILPNHSRYDAYWRWLLNVPYVHLKLLISKIKFI